MRNWSRKRKLAAALLVLLASLAFIVSMSEWPSPTLEIAVRRAERQQLIGPSEIVAQLDHGYYSDCHVVLGKTEHGWITYEYIDDLGWDNAELRFFPNEEIATVFCIDFRILSEAENWLPIFAVPKNRAAVSAEMTLSITTEEYNQTYLLESSREPEGYFLFHLSLAEEQPEEFWLLQQAITGSWQEYVISGTVDIRIDFYNRSGTLVDTYSKTVTK